VGPRDHLHGALGHDLSRRRPPAAPSQPAYEALLEGLVLAVLLITLFWKTRARWRPGLLVGLFTLGYGLSLHRGILPRTGRAA
jgi:prolipoprotein diacylglyceryltransferase